VIWRRGAVAAPAMALRPPPTAAPMPAPCPPPAIAPITAPVPAPTRPPPSARYAGLYGSAKAVVAQHQSCADHAGHDRLLCHSLSTEKPRNGAGLLISLQPRSRSNSPCNGIHKWHGFCRSSLWHAAHFAPARCGSPAGTGRRSWDRGVLRLPRRLGRTSLCRAGGTGPQTGLGPTEPGDGGAVSTQVLGVPEEHAGHPLLHVAACIWSR